MSKKEKIEYFCSYCKRFANFDETRGEIGGFSGLSLGGKLPRYHMKCGQRLIELKKKEAARKNG